MGGLPTAGEYTQGYTWVVQGLHAAVSVLVFWNTESACLKVMFVMRKANTLAWTPCTVFIA